jgi:predicted transcriptional regulator
METAMAMRTLSTDLPSELADKIAKLATSLDRSAEGIVAEALAEWVDRQERDHTLTLEGLADVDAGRLLDHEDIGVWIASMGGRPAS